MEPNRTAHSIKDKQTTRCHPQARTMDKVAITQTLQIQLTANKMDKQTKEETTKEKGSPRRSSTRGSKCSGPVKAVGQNVLKWKYLRTQNIRPHSFILLTHRFANFAVRTQKTADARTKTHGRDPASALAAGDARRQEGTTALSAHAVTANLVRSISLTTAH